MTNNRKLSTELRAKMTMYESITKAYKDNCIDAVIGLRAAVEGVYTNEHGPTDADLASIEQRFIALRRAHIEWTGRERMRDNFIADIREVEKREYVRKQKGKKK